MHVWAGCYAACRCAVRQQAATLFLPDASCHVLVPVHTSGPARNDSFIAICSSYASLHGDLECDGHLEEQYERRKSQQERCLQDERNQMYEVIKCIVQSHYFITHQ
jgi:hypothetical protein